MTKIVCIYHRVDLDGQCSAAIVRRYAEDQGREISFVPYNYGDKIPWGDLKGEDVIMVDCSFPIEDMRKLQKLAASFTWIDHHRSAIEAMRQARVFPPGQREEGRAGCELTWDYFFSGHSMPKTVYLLGRHDVWDLEADMWVEPFQYAMRSFDMDPCHPLWKKLFEMDGKEQGEWGGPPEIESLILMGYHIQRYQILQDQAAAQGGAINTSIEGPDGTGYRAIACNSAGRGSQLFDSVYDETRHDVMIVYRRTKRRTWAASLYSYKEGVPCHEIAKMHGGGGHPGAAGFEVEELPFEY